MKNHREAECCANCKHGRRILLLGERGYCNFGVTFPIMDVIRAWFYDNQLSLIAEAKELDTLRDKINSIKYVRRIMREDNNLVVRHWIEAHLLKTKSHMVCDDHERN